MNENELKLVHYVLVVVGAIGAAIFFKSRGELQRAPFFFGTASVALCLTLTEYVWLSSIEAAAYGFMWALLLISVSLKLVGGYVIGVMAIARSRDAFGHGKFAFLAFIPILGLLLVFRGSKNASPTNRIPTIRIATGYLGAISGLVALSGMIAANVYLIQRSNEVFDVKPGKEAVWIDSLVRTQGLETTLKYIAAYNTSETRVGEVTVLKYLSANGRELTRNYIVEKKVQFFNETFRSNNTKAICNENFMRALIDEGATIKEKFDYTDGENAGTNSISLGDCAIVEAKTPEATVVAMIKYRGLENTLKEIADTSGGSKRIDNITVLKSISADARNLVRHYVVEQRIKSLSPEFGQISANAVCQYKFLRVLLKAGATVREQYSDADGREIGDFPITIRSCE